MLYFAHGSYIDPHHMRVCCPGAAFVIPGRLPDYRLCFPRWSKVRDSAVAGIEPAKGETAWGVLYELTPEDLLRLDRLEGYAEGRDAAENTAQRIGVRVERTDGLTVAAETHVAVAMADPGTPREGYLFLLARAAKAFDFAEDYVAKLGGSKIERLAA